MFKFLLRIAALVGIGYAAKQLSKKENRERVVEEYNKVKEDPKKYAQDVQEKVSSSASEYQEKAKEEYNKVQEKAKEEYNKVKEDPKAYSEELQTKAKQEFEKVKSNAEGKVQEIRNKKDETVDTEAQEARFDDETPAPTDIDEVKDADFDNNVLRDYEETEEEIIEKNKDNHKTVVTKNDDK